MPEMADAGEHHRDAALVGRGDHLVVANAAARLDDRRGTVVGDDVEPVAKRKERVRRDDGAASDSPAALALIAAIRVESTRLICPAPMPSVRSAPQYTIALLLTCFATRHANRRSRNCASRRRFRRHDLQVVRGETVCVRALHKSPPPMRFRSACGGGHRGSELRARARSSSARSRRAHRREAGAISTSRNWAETASIVAASIGRLNAMMPPKAETGSVANAFGMRERRIGDGGAAGIRVLHDDASGASADASDFTHSHAASESARLLNDSSLPCS
jgi:hypothetical protein